MDLSKAQAGAEMAPADPAAHLTSAAAAPVGEAHGSRGTRAAGLGTRAEAGLEPCHRMTCAESLWGIAA